MVNTTLPKLDRRAIAEVEAVTVHATLDTIADRDRRLETAARIADEAQATADKLRPKRDAAALSLAFHDQVRGLSGVVGVNRTRFYEMRGNVTRKNVPHDPDAAKKLPGLAQRVAAAEERARAARAIRDQLVAEFLHEGRTPVEVAELIGRNRSRVWQVVKKAGV